MKDFLGEGKKKHGIMWGGGPVWMRLGPLAKSEMFYIFQEKNIWEKKNLEYSHVSSLLYKYLCLLYCDLYFVYVWHILWIHVFLESFLKCSMVVQPQFCKYSTNGYRKVLHTRSIEYGWKEYKFQNPEDFWRQRKRIEEWGSQPGFSPEWVNGRFLKSTWKIAKH